MAAAASALVSPAKYRSLTTSALSGNCSSSRSELHERRGFDRRSCHLRDLRVEFDPLEFATVLTRFFRRAFSTRIRRIASAAAPKK